MLIGSYQHTVDDKGRIFIPAKLKSDLGDSFVVVRGFKRNIMAFSEKEFASFEAKYRQIPMTDTAAQDFFRMFFASAKVCEVDKQGRTLIPQELRDYAGIGDTVTLVGMITKVEIWDQQELQRSTQMSEDTYLNTLSELSSLGV